MLADIAAVVYAHDEKEARKRGKAVFQGLSCKGCQQPFEGFQLRHAVARAVSPGGRRVIEQCMEHTRTEFLDHLKRLRAALATASDEEIYLSRHPDLDVRFEAYGVGRYDGPGIYLYDGHGAGIRLPSHLQDVLEKWPGLQTGQNRERLDLAGDVWVVTAEVHY
jgi:hypothetical protein